MKSPKIIYVIILVVAALVMVCLIVACQKQPCYQCTKTITADISTTIWNVDNITDSTRREYSRIVNLSVTKDSVFFSPVDLSGLEIKCELID